MGREISELWKEVIDGHVYYKLSNGFNFRMSEFSAALGIAHTNGTQLDKILEFKRAGREI